MRAFKRLRLLSPDPEYLRLLGVGAQHPTPRAGTYLEAVERPGRRCVVGQGHGSSHSWRQDLVPLYYRGKSSLT